MLAAGLSVLAAVCVLIRLGSQFAIFCTGTDPLRASDPPDVPAIQDSSERQPSDPAFGGRP